MSDIDANASDEMDYRYGAATYDKCDVHLNSDYFEFSDYKYSDDGGWTVY
jgi:hypothetical protein